MQDDGVRLDLAARLDHVADEIIETRRALFALAAAQKLQRLDGPKLAADSAPRWIA